MEHITHDNPAAQEGLRIADAFAVLPVRPAGMGADEYGALWFEAMAAVGLETEEGSDGE